MDWRCDKCRHWKIEGTEDWEAERAGFGECVAIKERWRITEAVGGHRVHSEWDWETMTKEERSEAMMNERSAALKAERAYVQDGSEYRAELYTGPDFFCAKFEVSIRQLPQNPR